MELTAADAGMPSSWARYVRGYMKRHPKTRGGPMAPINGDCYVAPTKKPQPSEGVPDPGESPAPEEGGDED